MFRKLMILGLVSIFAVAIVGCETDMEIVNNNEPDTQKVLASPDDIESLLGGTFLEMWDGGLTETEMEERTVLYIYIV